MNQQIYNISWNHEFPIDSFPRELKAAKIKYFRVFRPDQARIYSLLYSD